MPGHPAHDDYPEDVDMSLRRSIATIAIALAAFVTNGNHARAEPGQVSAAESPYPDVTGAQWIKLEGAKGRKFLTAIFRPDGPGPFPVVVLLHGSDGLLKDYASIAQEVARAGFLVVYGCWSAGYLGTSGNRLCSEATPAIEYGDDPAANSGEVLIAFARTLPGARADRIGLYGLSFGGNAALWAASTGADVQAVVVDAPYVRFPEPLKVLPNLSAPVLLMQGTDDEWVPLGPTREYEKAARDLGKPLVAVYFEGIGHVVSDQAKSRAEARQRAIAFLRDQLLK